MSDISGSDSAGSDISGSKLAGLTIGEARDLLSRREVSSVELTRACLERIDAVESSVRSFITLTPEGAMAQAERADSMLSKGEGSPLTGIPMQVKGRDVHRRSSNDLRLTNAGELCAGL